MTFGFTSMAAMLTSALVLQLVAGRRDDVAAGEWETHAPRQRAGSPATLMGQSAAPAAKSFDEGDVDDTSVAIALDRVGEARIGEAFDPDNWLQEWTAGPLQGEVDCLQYTGGVLPDGVSMMVMDGSIARFELDANTSPEAALRVRAPFGLHLGMSRADVVASLPTDAALSPHAYSAPDGQYLTWQDADAGLGVRVELMSGHVDSIFWGDASAITLVEGCS